MYKKPFHTDTAPLVPQPVVFSSRPERTLTCPHCWTTQQALRNRCYRCCAIFHFEDEAYHPLRNDT